MIMYNVVLLSCRLQSTCGLLELLHAGVKSSGVDLYFIIDKLKVDKIRKQSYLR